VFVLVTGRGAGGIRTLNLWNLKPGLNRIYRDNSPGGKLGAQTLHESAVKRHPEYKRVVSILRIGHVRDHYYPTIGREELLIHSLY
jgi:hypothetical protein